MRESKERFSLLIKGAPTGAEGVYMEELKELLALMLDENLEQIVLSDAVAKENGSKIKIRPLQIKGELLFQATRYSGAQVFHTNLPKVEMAERIETYLNGWFRQAQFRSKEYSAYVLVSKRGHISVKKRKISLQEQNGEPTNSMRTNPVQTSLVQNNLSQTDSVQTDITFPISAQISSSQTNFAQANPAQTSSAKTSPTQTSVIKPSLAHNRIKHYLLPEGEPIDFLVDLGVMTKEGKVVKAKYDKFRQINRYLEFVEDVLPDLPTDSLLRIVDFGCGKSYLTFALYYYLHLVKGISVELIGLDLKEDVIRRCQELAIRYGYDTLHFEIGEIASYHNEDPIDMVISLHACDTATDAALAKAVSWGAKVIFAVPCCQHEVAKQIQNDVMNPMLRYGIMKERFSALLTDTIRAGLLEHQGYRVQILEFIDMEHTPKNLLIRAVKKQGFKAPAKERADADALKNLIRFYQVSPALAQYLDKSTEEP
ncbi:MAG: SAM-dependent methyltransferase [Clostridium sp.]|nr:SAM-dependent methyltransferase [Clostridium sp.]